MRHAIPRLSYHVSNRDYDLPELFPSCRASLDSWLIHCISKHTFTKCANLDSMEDSYTVMSTDTDT